jgi:hypothetical protein
MPVHRVHGVCQNLASFAGVIIRSARPVLPARSVF